jgi:hypothetical protein
MLAFGCVLLFALPVVSQNKDAKVPFEVFAKGYFVKNTVKLEGNPAFLVLPDKNAFDNVFGFGRVMGAKPKLVEESVFEKNLIAVVVKAGNAVTTYEVEQVRRDKDKLVVQYKATAGNASTAQFRSSLIVSVPRAGVTEVVFLENGKEAGKAAVKK